MTNEEWAKMAASFKTPKASAKFDAWMRKVDEKILRITGVISRDLPDFCYRDAFDDGANFSQAARAAIRAAKEF